jgi:hypothetical protein
MTSSAYEDALTKIEAEVSPHRLSPDGGPALIREHAAALWSAVRIEPRDMAAVTERVIALAASALRVIRSLGEAGELGSSFANPTAGRLPGMIDDYAPNTANAWIGRDDWVQRFADEMIGAAERYANADPRTVDGSGPARARALFRVVGLAAHGLSV